MSKDPKTKRAPYSIIGVQAAEKSFKVKIEQSNIDGNLQWPSGESLPFVLFSAPCLKEWLA